MDISQTFPSHVPAGLNLGNAERVGGILPETKDRLLRISAKSIILSTGGFLGNKELIKQYFHSYYGRFIDDAQYVEFPDNSDGLFMADWELLKQVGEEGSISEIKTAAVDIGDYE